jgi:hypothetical protein
MSTSADDISIVLSGGNGNIFPNQSLGGDPSASPIPNGVLNNLFSDISSERTEESEDAYRCIYVFNDGDATVWDLKIYTIGNSSDGSTSEIGIEERNEAQRIVVTGSATGGTLTLKYKQTEFTTTYNSDLALWANNLQNQIETIEEFKYVRISAQSASSGSVVFDIRWSRKDAKRNFDKIEIATNQQGASVGNLLQPLGQIAVNISVLQQGGPINTIASEINVETTPPNYVGFFVASFASPITIPRLDPSDGFPLWIKRTVTLDAVPQSNDGFSLVVQAQWLEPEA